MKRKKRIGTVGKAIGCLFFLMVSLFPIYWLVAMAIRPTDEMRGHIALIPQSLTGIHFAELFSAKNFGTAIINSLQTTFGSLFVSLVVGICAAYIIARRRFRFGLKKPMTYWVLLVRVLPPVAFTIPLYIMFNKLGILNTKLPVLLACVLINVPLIIWFLISFFQDLPEEVEESAKVDGATEWQLFCRIVLPLVAPGIAAVAMLSFMYAWNEYTYTVIFTRTAVNNSQNKELATELLSYLMDKDVQKSTVPSGGVPCRYSSLQDAEILKTYPQYEVVCKALEGGMYRPVIAEWTQFYTILGAEMDNIVNGVKTVDQGLADAQTQLEALMK